LHAKNLVPWGWNKLEQPEQACCIIACIILSGTITKRNREEKAGKEKAHRSGQFINT